MNCHNARQHWNLYHDSEGDAELHFAVSEHLAMCPACADWFQQQSRLEERLAEKLRPVPATEAVWSRVLAQARVTRPLRSRGRWIWASAACAAGVLVAALWYTSGLRPDARRSAADLSELSAAWHERLLTGAELIPFASNNDLAVEGYLRQRVTFPVRCPPRKDAGFAVQGAGTCELAKQPAAFLLGQVNDTPVSILILSKDSLPAFPREFEALRSADIHQCREGDYMMVLGVKDRNAIVIIGRTDPAKLLRVLNAYGTYPDHHG